MSVKKDRGAKKFSATRRAPTPSSKTTRGRNHTNDNQTKNTLQQMKKTLITMSLALLGAMGLQAQEQGGEPRRDFDPAQMQQRRTERMAEHYKLSEEQKKQLTELNNKYAEKLFPPRPMRQRGPREGMDGGARTGGAMRPGQPDGVTSATAQAGKKQDTDALKEYEKSLQKILTDEQWNTYRQQRMRPEDVTSKLQLTEKQAKKVQKLNKKYAGKLPQQNANAPRPEGQRPGEPRRGGEGGPQRMTDEERQQMQANREAYEKELQAILTAEQWEAYQKDQKEHQQRRPAQEQRP